MHITNDARRGPKPFAVITIIAAALFFALPLISVFYFSLHGAKGHLGFSAYERVFRDRQFTRSFLFSLSIALEVIILSFAITLPAVMQVRLRLRRLQPALETISNLPFTVPAIVLAFGLIRLYSSPPLLLTPTPFLLAAGNVIICLPYVYRSVDAGLSTLPVETWFEAGASLSVSKVRVFFTVVIPNMRTALISAASLVFAIVMGELTLAVMLAWPAFGPYMALVGRDLAYEPAALAVLSFFMTWISVAVFHATGGTRNKKRRDDK